MKRIATITALMIIFISVLSSQNYYPLPESNSFWVSTEHDIPEWCGCNGICSEEQYRISGDTLINSLIYHKLIHSGYWISDDCEKTYFSNGYQGAFRNDIENKKVWFVPAGEFGEGLLYEFDLQVGDTLTPGILNPYNYWDFWVEDIDSVEFGYSFRKVLLIRSQLNLGEMPLRIIEGIGGQNLIEPMDYWLNFEVGYLFKCININDSLLYGNETCDLITGTNPELYDLSFGIFPNPSNGQLWIRIPIVKDQSIQLEIYNSCGIKVGQYNTYSHFTHIDLSEFPKGIYFLNYTAGSSIIGEKIILQ